MPNPHAIHCRYWRHFCDEQGLIHKMKDYPLKHVVGCQDFEGTKQDKQGTNRNALFQLQLALDSTLVTSKGMPHKHIYI